MKKNIRVMALGALLAGVVGSICFFIGQSTVLQDTQSISLESRGVEREQKIAVVNLDEGTAADGKEKVYYGEKVIRFPSSSVVYTSLEDARRGIENDIYAAYIIIPSTFSDSVNSLNGTPTQANIQYALNTDLDGAVQTEVLYQVLTFGESLNTDLSYMYLANILQEFHQAQDDTSIVMTNDLKDKDAIDTIQTLDLVKMVSVPEVIREENTTVPLDISTYMETNSFLTDNVDDEYKTNIENAKIQLTSIQEDGNQLAAVLDELTKNVEEINLTVDENGTNVYESGLISLTQIMSNYNEKLSGSKSKASANMGTLESQRASIVEKLNKSVEDYNKKLSTETMSHLATYRNDLNTALPQLTCTVVDGTDEMQFQISCNEIEGKGTPPLVTLSIETENSQENMQKKACIDAIMTRLADAANSEETEIKSLADIFTECDEDEVLMEAMELCEYNSSLIMFTDFAAGNISMDEVTSRISLNGDIADIETYIRSALETVDTKNYQLTPYADTVVDAEGNKTTITSLLNDYKNLITNTQSGVSAIEMIDSRGVQDIVDTGCIRPLVDRTEKVKNTFQQRHTDETAQITGYQRILENYNPLMNTSVMMAYAAQVGENGSQMQKSVMENKQSYMDFTNKVYTTTQENMITLQSHIQEAKETSEHAVESGLADAKSIKAKTSDKNQQAMAEFAGKLPFTRLGTVEYTQAYEFIANPLLLSQVSDYQRLKDDVSLQTDAPAASGLTAGPNEKSKKYVQWILYAVLLVLILAVLTVYIIRTKRRQSQQPHSMGN